MGRAKGKFTGEPPEFLGQPGHFASAVDMQLKCYIYGRLLGTPEGQEIFENLDL